MRGCCSDREAAALPAREEWNSTFTSVQLFRASDRLVRRGDINLHYDHAGRAAGSGSPVRVIVNRDLAPAEAA